MKQNKVFTAIIAIVLVASMVLSSGSIGTGISNTWELSGPFVFTDNVGNPIVRYEGDFILDLKQNGDVIQGSYTFKNIKLTQLHSFEYVQYGSTSPDMSKEVSGTVSSSHMEFTDGWIRFSGDFNSDSMELNIESCSFNEMCYNPEHGDPIPGIEYAGEPGIKGSATLKYTIINENTPVDDDSSNKNRIINEDTPVGGDISDTEGTGFKFIDWFINIIDNVLSKLIYNEGGTVEFIEHSPEIDDTGTVHVIGKLKNTDDRSISFIEVCVNFYDAEGNVLDSSCDWVDNLGSEEIWVFDIMHYTYFYNEDAAYYKIGVSTDDSSPIDYDYGQSTPIIYLPTLELTPAACIVDQECYLLMAQAKGGTSPYTFMFDPSGGDIPSGLTMDVNGYLKGVPVDEGSYTLGVCVVDADGTTVCDETTVAITKEEDASVAGTWSGSYTETSVRDGGCTYNNRGTLEMIISVEDNSFSGSAFFDGIELRWMSDCTFAYYTSSLGTVSGTFSGNNFDLNFDYFVVETDSSTKYHATAIINDNTMNGEFISKSTGKTSGTFILTRQ